MKDTSNIFKLPSNELETKKSSLDVLWDDTAPEIVDFARKLQGLLQSVDTPYVIGLDGGYGTGKTHFATRFAAQMHEQIKTIYFSAWEKDYIKEPLDVFVEQIAWLVKTEKDIIDKLNQPLVQKLLTSWWKTTDFNLRLSLKGLPLDVTTNLKKFIKKVNELELPQDIFQEAKRNLAEYIKLLPQDKLVFIVDDLDRCRPDTAVKVLEIVKHFFDIDGLIVVIPINQSRLRQYIDAFYGIGGTAEQKGVIAEDYLQKFFNDIIDIPNLNYEKICADRITEEEFRSNLVYEGDSYNNIQELRKWIAEYAKKSEFSYRETVEIIRKAKMFCNKYHEPIRCRLLAYTLCDRHNINKRRANVGAKNLQYGETNLYAEGIPTPRTALLNKRPAYNELNHISHVAKSSSGFDVLVKRAGTTPKTYDELYKIINYCYRKIVFFIENDFTTTDYFHKQIQPILKNLLVGLKQQKKAAQDLQRLHGSDDRDLERAEEYENIICNPHLLGDK